MTLWTPPLGPPLVQSCELPSLGESQEVAVLPARFLGTIRRGDWVEPGVVMLPRHSNQGMCPSGSAQDIPLCVGTKLELGSSVRWP